MTISNFDLFVQLYNDIKNGASIDKICKNYGGDYMYIPSYKNTFRNGDIIKDFKYALQNSSSTTLIIRKLSQKYELSYGQIRNIIKSSKADMLFD